jgi:GTP-binding protein HflX
LLHVVDVSAPTASEQTAHVLKVLGEIGAEKTSQVLVLNKSDCLPAEDSNLDLETLTHRLLGETARQNATQAVLVSAQTGSGLDQLFEAIDSHLAQDPVARQRFKLPLCEGRALHLLHDRAAVISKHYADDYCEVLADAPESIRQKLAEFAVDVASEPA